MSEIEMQKVWRTLSKTEGSGFFVWEVLRVVGETDNKPYFTECLDGSNIYIQCFHYWTLEKAEAALNDKEFDRYQTVEIIPNRIMKKGDWVKSKRLNLMGVIEDVAFCRNYKCNKMELTLDRKGKGVRFYHHTEHFELMTEEEILKEVRGTETYN